MSYNPKTGIVYVSDAALLNIFRAIQQSPSGATIVDIIVETRINPTTVNFALKELRIMGCIRTKQRGGHFPAYNYATNHKCGYCS